MVVSVQVASMDQKELFLLGIIIIIIIYTSALADGLSLEFEWQQVSSGLQDSFQYSGRSQ